MTSTDTLYSKGFGSALSAFLRPSHTLPKETFLKDRSNQAQRIAARQAARFLLLYLHKLTGTYKGAGYFI